MKGITCKLFLRGQHPSMPHSSGCSARSAHARVVLWDHPWAQKWLKMIFPKLFLDHLGEWLKAQVAQGYFEPSCTHMSPCKLQKSLKMGNFGTDNVAQERPQGMRVEG